MTFNLRTAAAPDRANRWGQRRELAIELIRTFAPDVIGLQEVHSQKQAPDLRFALPEYHLLGIERGGTGESRHEMCAVLVRTETFEVVSERHFWLSKTPNTAGSRAWASAYPRTAALIHLRKRSNQFDVLYANAHLDFLPWSGLEGARLLRRELEALPFKLPVVVSGDFNAGRNSAVHRELAGASSARPLLDIIPTGDPGTYHAFGKLPIPQAYDWFLVSPGLRVIEAGIDRSNRAPLYPSDHYPVWVILDESV